MLHGENCGHVTDDCFTLKAQAKRMKGTWDAQTPDKKKAFKDRQELNAMISEAVAGAIKEKTSKKKKSKKDQELNAFGEYEVSSDEDSLK